MFRDAKQTPSNIKELYDFSLITSEYSEEDSKSESRTLFMNNACLQIFTAQILGSGSFGKVYLGVYKGHHDTDFQQVAVKEVVRDYLNEDFATSVNFHEAAIMQNLAEIPYLVKMIASHIDSQNGMTKKTLVLEYMQNGSLTDFIKQDKNHDWGIYLQILTDASSGIYNMHKNGYLHLDIKSGNILLDRNYRAKLGDFGYTTHESNVTSASLGTPPFMAPEIWSRPAIQSQKADIYALGIVILEIIAGDRFDEVREYALDGGVPYCYYYTDWQFRLKLINQFIADNCPLSISELVQDCIQLDYNQRPTAEEANKRLTVMSKIHGEVHQVFFARGPSASNKLTELVREYAVDKNEFKSYFPG